MKYLASVLYCVSTINVAIGAELVLAEKGQSRCAIVVDANVTAPEKYAALDLVTNLNLITGATFRIEPSAKPDETAVFVGAGKSAQESFPDIDFAQLASEEVVIKTSGKHLLLAGGGTRGTQYAVSRFLQDHCGVRWWTPWASRIPKKADLAVEGIDVRVKPAFELREPFWYPAFDPTWAVRNGCNGQSAKIPAEMGGCIRYKGFVHTFYPLVPPDKHFAEHPEWFSEIDGKRTTERAQLCLTNPKLREFVVGRVREWLRESREASIISVSQNDWHGACKCADCQAIDEAEGSHSGSLLAFINYVAERIESEFPHVAIDTLAYQYTRKPPRTIKPRSNVIIRLCSIECNFREPLSHPSNASFADDIRGWAKICQRLYIWDYTTDFAHYVQPHPNWFTLGENVRFFQRNNVRGVFEQGAYQSHGSEMAEMRAWVLAQLLWNPRQDERALINEFLDGYYGAAAAKHIRKYLDLMHEASRGHNLTCYSGTDAPFLRFQHLSEAERLWQAAERVVNEHPKLLARARVAHLPLGYVWLSRWNALRKECGEAEWPLPASHKMVIEQWRTVAQGVSGLPWTKVSLLNEGGLTVDAFLNRVSSTPEEPVTTSAN